MERDPHPEGRLALRKQLAYAAPATALALIGTTFYVFVPKFYSDVVGVRLGVLSLVVLFSRIWDALIDPAAGHLSDRTRTRWGRRRPWMCAAALPLAVAFLCVAAPPAALSSNAASAWLGGWTFLLFLFWTAAVIPYEALGAELTFDHDERNRLFGWREGAMILGTVLAAVLPEVLGGVFGDSQAAAQRATFATIGGVGALLLLPAVGFSVLSLPERQLRDAQIPQPLSGDGLGTVFRNKPFRILVIAYTVSALGSQLPATLILFYVQHVLGNTRGGLFLLLYLATGFAFIPLWVFLGGRLEKRTAWVSAMAVNTLAFAGVALLGQGDAGWYAALVALSAVGLGGTVVIPASMEADVIDCDEAENGVRREGVFSGIWSICKKLAAALGAGIGLAALDAAGYVPNSRQPESAVLALRWLYAGVPCVCNMVAIAIASRYPITRGMHAALRREIDERVDSSGGGP